MKKNDGQKSRGVPRRAGKSRGKREKYFSRTNKFAERKLRKIIRSNGEQEAERWAEERGVEKIFEKIARARKPKKKSTAPTPNKTKSPSPLPPKKTLTTAGGAFKEKLLSAVKMTAEEVKELSVNKPNTPTKPRRKRSKVKCESRPRNRKKPSQVARGTGTKNPAEGLAKFFRQTKRGRS